MRGPWGPKEDSLVKKAVIAKGVEGIKWSEIAKLVPGRLGKQVRERWLNYLDPALKKTPFNKDEEMLLKELHLQYGNKWKKISQNMPGRSENQIKNKFNSVYYRMIYNIEPKKTTKNEEPKKTKKNEEVSSSSSSATSLSTRIPSPIFFSAPLPINNTTSINSIDYSNNAISSVLEPIPLISPPITFKPIEQSMMINTGDVRPSSISKNGSDNIQTLV